MEPDPVQQGRPTVAVKEDASDAARRFVNVCLIVAFALAAIGFGLGASQGLRFEYPQRALPGVFLATIQKFLAPGIQNGFMIGLWAAVFYTLSRRWGGGVWLRLGLALIPVLLTAFAFSYYTRAALEGRKLINLVNILLTFKSATEALDFLVRLGMAAQPLYARFLRISGFALIGLLSMFVLQGIFGRRWARKDIRTVAAASLWPSAVSFLGIVALSILLGRSATDKLPPDAPDVILISIDTLRADHLPVYGYERDTAPNLSSLAADGVVVDPFISHAPWTLPSHASMFTGLLPHEHGAVDWQFSIPNHVGLFTENLKQRSYRTGGFVTAVYVSDAFGFDRGFDLFQFDDTKNATETVRDAARWLFADRRPSFLFIHLFDVHHPYAPPPSHMGLYGPPSPAITEPNLHFSKFLRWAETDPAYTAPTAINRYDELIAYVDTVLGYFFQALKAANRYDNTMIVVLSDHGEEFYDHGYWGHSNYLYEEMLRVPLIVKFPGGACAGSRLTDRPVPANTLPRLIMDAVSAQTAAEALRCRPEGAPQLLWELGQTDPILSETQSEGPHRFSARAPHAKLIEPFQPFTPLRSSGKWRGWEYYRLDTDPREKTNLYAPGAAPELEEVLSDANRRLAEAATQTQSIELDEGTLERLRSLGYLN